MFKSVAILARTDRNEAINLAKEIGSHLEAKGLLVKFESEVADRLGLKRKSTTDFKVDLLVTIGGDGTVLRAFHITNGSVPIFPIRMGTVGFLCDEDWNNGVSALNVVLEGKYERDECFSLQSDLETPLALNEFRIGCPLPSHPMEIEVRVDKYTIARDKLDGMIVSTNTGASAYALSAGANIIDPRLKAIMLVPICALSTNFKPYVVPSDSTVSIKLIGEGDLMIVVDGEYQGKLSGVREIRIYKSPKILTILRTKWNFYERLKRRLNITSAILSGFG